MTWDGFLGSPGKETIENKIYAMFYTASFGGIFGLCLGGSLISFIEIFYYFSLKLYANYYGMVETTVPEDEKQNQKLNEVNIFKISSFPTDNTLKIHPKLGSQSKVGALQASATPQSLSYDRYLD